MGFLKYSKLDKSFYIWNFYWIYFCFLISSDSESIINKSQEFRLHLYLTILILFQY